MDELVEVHGEPDEGVTWKLAAAGERRRKRHCVESRLAPCWWKTPGEQQRYSCRVLDALRRVLSRGPPPPARDARVLRGRAVREAADRALAAAAGGRTRWSRAILASCRSLKLRKKRRAGAPRCARRRKAVEPLPAVGAEEDARATVRKVRMLGRIVPGCRRLLLPSLLEEASDYLAALEMQVRAMSAVVEALSSRIGCSTSYDRVGPSFSTSSYTFQTNL